MFGQPPDAVAKRNTSTPAVTLTQDDQNKIDTLAAHFVEDSELLMGLSGALTDAVKRYVARDRKQQEQAATPRPRLAERFARNMKI